MYTIASRYFMYTLGFMGLRSALKKEESTIEVPSFRGIIEVVHKLNGRIRFKIPSLKGSQEGFEELISQLKRIPSITEVEGNPVTGSLLIKHTDEIQPTLIVGILVKLLGLEELVQKPPSAYVTTEFQSAKESFSLAVNEKTHGILDLKSILFLFFTTIGVKKIMEDPTILPNGFTFLWWGFTMLK